MPVLVREWRWHGVEKADKGLGGRIYSAARRRRYYEYKEGKGCERGRRWGSGKERERGRRWPLPTLPCEETYRCLLQPRTEDERKSGIRGASLQLPRPGHAPGRSQGCQRVLGGIQNLLGIGIKKSLSINLSSPLGLRSHRVEITRPP